ncbi:MAG TPA: carbon-nitrogen hydrolase family protein [Steroidobacteraceae bacterium]|nr:carbon-nitrogen hydrolase family protein [Steroidobacteraceae bacterium]
MKFAAIQMTSGIDVAANVATARRLLAEAAGQGAQLAVLPENFALMAQRERDKRAIAETDGGGPVQDQLSQCARALGITLVAGTFPIRVPGEERVAAASLVYGPDGGRIGRYDKIHLFDVNVPDAAESHRESAGMVPGRGIGVFDTPAGRIGVAVCYDLRFPELFRRMIDAGAQAFVVSAAFTVPTGEAHWHLLLRTRAVENLCALVAAAQVGTHQNGRQTYGHSAIVDCWGRVVAELPAGEGVVVGDVDFARQARVRAEFPALEHRVFGRTIS